jgi:hypothetical protein
MQSSGCCTGVAAAPEAEAGWAAGVPMPGCSGLGKVSWTGFGAAASWALCPPTVIGGCACRGAAILFCCWCCCCCCCAGCPGRSFGDTNIVCRRLWMLLDSRPAVCACSCIWYSPAVKRHRWMLAASDKLLHIMRSKLGCNVPKGRMCAHTYALQWLMPHARTGIHCQS